MTVISKQWRTLEEYEAMRRDPAPLPSLPIATFEPGMCEVVETFGPTMG
jgi:hypothetical protein